MLKTILNCWIMRYAFTSRVREKWPRRITGTLIAIGLIMLYIGIVLGFIAWIGWIINNNVKH